MSIENKEIQENDINLMLGNLEKVTSIIPKIEYIYSNLDDTKIKKITTILDNVA